MIYSKQPWVCKPTYSTNQPTNQLIHQNNNNKDHLIDEERDDRKKLKVVVPPGRKEERYHPRESN